jgi:hypothetical protein
MVGFLSWRQICVAESGLILQERAMGGIMKAIVALSNRFVRSHRSARTYFRASLNNKEGLFAHIPCCLATSGASQGTHSQPAHFSGSRFVGS